MHYCHRHQNRNPDCHIFWVYGATAQNFDDGYRKIARELQIPGHDDPSVGHRRVVPRELNKTETGPWIMVLDNADDQSIFFPPQNRALCEAEQRNFLAFCLPEGSDSGGRIVISTRNRKLGEDLARYPPISVEELTPTNAKELLHRKLEIGKWE